MRELFGAPARESEVCRDDLLVSLLVLAWFIEARDPYTGGHLWRVSRLARGLAQASGMWRAEAARVTLGGLLHDLGKIAVPDHVLRKTSNSKSSALRSVCGPSRIFTSSGGMVEFVRASRRTRREGKTT